MEKWNIQGKLIIHKKRKINIFQMVLVEFKKKKSILINVQSILKH